MVKNAWVQIENCRWVFSYDWPSASFVKSASRAQLVTTFPSFFAARMPCVYWASGPGGSTCRSWCWTAADSAARNGRL